MKVEPEPIILQPDLVKARFFDLYLGGFPSSSIPDDGHDPNWKWPIDNAGHSIDQTDRDCERNYREFLSYSTIAEMTNSPTRRLEALANAYRRQTWFLLAPDPIEDVMCDDKSCTNLLELGRKSGKCQACKMRESRKRKKASTQAE